MALILCSHAAPVNKAKHTGQATFFTPGLGACGKNSKSSDHMVAVSSQFFKTFPGAGANPNTNPICGKKLTASFKGKSTTVTILDECPSCAEFDLDLSPAAFKDLADESVGRLHGMTWHLD
ncbi:hypothetical protein PUNSTDRAFT_133915 [Punctularia strigosozonata HHB-11173 SS5]|uniref:uncharacterized protein n=1 Tax=Punctularia strigosozonata (strain HHB-11173) TaxID=741275 RepID=UPI0004417F26|nr:uncharacterized protein PUNSTDRAFT_133915 [Punctularia strigosozonata HHB-11173 SS5]EIN08732.1 hypothetical protein PUNSTDRAFT_133915 [Punctularia strigosozonata HHB-11173 SS5]